MVKDDSKVSAWILNNSHYRGFIAGIEYQDKRIEALTDMLKATGVNENIINEVLSHVDSLR